MINSLENAQIGMKNVSAGRDIRLIIGILEFDTNK